MSFLLQKSPGAARISLPGLFFYIISTKSVFAQPAQKLVQFNLCDGYRGWE